VATVTVGAESGGRLSAELRAFYELARVVGAGPYTVGEILDRICTEVRTGFGFDRALLVRYNAEARTVHAVVQQNIDWPGDTWLQIEKFPFLERALTGRRAVFVHDPRAEAAMPSRIIERFGVRSIVAVPLVVGEGCLGFLVADRGGGSFTLSDADLQLLSTLGWVAAVFVEKADQYAELEEVLTELRGLDHAKNDFVSIASHELRTPIAVVHGIASTLHLRGDELTADQHHDLRHTLFEHTTRLAALAHDLLDLSRIDAGVVVPHPERFRPRERIETVLQQTVPDRVGDVRLELDPHLELVTDPDGFERIVANLVTNAFRYGEAPVEVTAEANTVFRLLVEDHGDGVDPAFVPRLFDRFSRSDLARTRTGGAGLGLAIARSYAQSLGGDLVYEQATKGARFALLLPADVVTA
jgi:signal transduction histidine kinase